MNIEDKVLRSLYRHASTCYPNECCGFIRHTTDGPTVIRVENVHPAPRNHFQMSPLDFITYSGGAICMYHSHPDGDARPSEGDEQIMRETDLPQLVISWPYGHLKLCGHTREPLMGRSFIYGLFDCYGLVRDYYAERLGIKLNDYERPRWGWWDSDTDNPIVNWYQHAGFGVVKDEVRPHDVVALRVAGANRPNHVGVITEKGRLLHHRLTSLSCEVNYERYYQDNTMMVLRYGC